MASETATKKGINLIPFFYVKLIKCIRLLCFNSLIE